MPTDSINFKEAAVKYCNLKGLDPEATHGVKFAGYKPEDPNHNPWPWVFRWEMVARDLEEHYYKTEALK